MEARLTLENLLQAAKILEAYPNLHSALPFTNVAAVQQQQKQQSLQTVIPTTVLDQPQCENDFSGKMRVERKLCSASTSAQPYCTVSPVSTTAATSRKNSTKHSRAAHNELEKTRRANLRSCLEQLKTLVPAVADASRNTTLALLTRARDHIKTLSDENVQLDERRQQLKERNEALRAEFERLRDSTVRTVDSNSCSTSVSRPLSRISRESPMFLEYSPSTKPSQSPRPVIIDPIAEGLLPAIPISYPRPSTYPYLDLNSLQSFLSSDVQSLLPIHLNV